jgi:RNA polymerase sigma-70 factor (ECF subfamily)
MAAPLNPEQAPEVVRFPTAEGAARDRLLLARIREGDTAAFDELFCAYRDSLGAFVLQIVRSREAAEEIVHDLFLRIWDGRDLWDFEGVFRAYLFRAARNRAISYLRHERADLRLRDRLTREQNARVPMSLESAADLMIEAGDLAGAIERAVARLPRRCQEVFRLSRHHGLSHAEVGKVMGIAPKTVEVQLRRALIALRAELARLR